MIGIKVKATRALSRLDMIKYMKHIIMPKPKMVSMDQSFERVKSVYSASDSDSMQFSMIFKCS
jgi:hypothetical protein